MKTEHKILTICYLNDEQWKIHQNSKLKELLGIKNWWMRFKIKYFIRAWAYNNDWLIYIKETEKSDMKLLHHEIGHAICNLEHSWKPGIMNAVRWLRWF
jgi:hypothetical protein